MVKERQELEKIERMQKRNRTKRIVMKYLLSTFRKGGAKLYHLANNILTLCYNLNDLAPPFLKVEKVEKVEKLPISVHFRSKMVLQ